MIKTKKNSRLRAKIKIRKRVFGTPEKPRFSVYRSLTNIYGQLIDDTSGVTLVSSSTLDKEIEAEVKKVSSKIERSKLVGALLAKRAAEKNITSVVFDRNGFLYHGRVKAVAEGAREGGLQF